MVLLQDRYNLVDQHFYVIIAGILSFLLQRADKSFVIEAGLLQKEPIKSRTVRGGQFLVYQVPALALVSIRVQLRAGLLSYRDYHLIGTRMILN
jgi:hypothetical protein